MHILCVLVPSKLQENAWVRSEGMQRHELASLSTASHVARARECSGALAVWMFIWLLGQCCFHDRKELT